MTLKGHYALSIIRRTSFGAHYENLNEDRQRRRCSPMTLDPGDIRFMRIRYSQGFPGKGASYNSGVIANVFCLGSGRYVFGTLGQHYYIVLFSPLSSFHWPQNTWPWVTLNGLKGHFTLYVHYYNRPLTNYLSVIYCRLFITRVTNTWPAENCGKRSIANSDPQNGRIFGIRGKSADLPWTLYRRNINK